MNAGSMRQILATMALFAMASENMFGNSENEHTNLSEEELRELREELMLRSIEFQKQLKLKRGCSEFTIEGIRVIALNEKNAIRKVANIKKALKDSGMVTTELFKK